MPSPEPTPPDADPESDHEGPDLATLPISAPQDASESILIDATASDESGIYVVLLHFKPQNADWQSLRMEPLAESPDYFLGELTPDLLAGAGSVSYYLEAADASTYHNTTLSPSTGEEGAYRFNLLY